MMISLILSILLSLVRPAAADVQGDIKAALDTVSKLKDISTISTGQHIYTMPAGGKMLTGTGDDFLRRRTADEILASNVAVGCGDYATSFYDLMHRQGYKTLYLDAAGFSAYTLSGGDEGHTGVAVQDPVTRHWILVDPTNQWILSDHLLIPLSDTAPLGGAEETPFLRCDG